MKLSNRASQLVLCASLLATAWPAPARPQSLPETVEAIDRARVATRILYVTAHPDDESSSALTYLARGLHADVALLSVTRGEGGQNALGPEQGPPLGVLRTEELVKATQQYGVRLFFTRAPDFGYSKSAEETLRIWDETPLADLVRVIRTFRPQIVINQWGGVHSGHGQHQAAGLLTPRAVAAAADPKAFPEQFAEGLAPWQVSQVLQMSRGESAGGYRLPSDQISPLWGKSYDELGREGFANHRTQGITAFLDSPFLRRSIYLIPLEGQKLDPASLAEPLVSLGDRFPSLASFLHPALERTDKDLGAARADALQLNWGECAEQLAEAGKEVAALEGRVKPDARAATEAEQATAELRRARAKIDSALELAEAVRLEARADRNELVAGETFGVQVERRMRLVGSSGGIGRPELVLPAGWQVTQQEIGPDGARFTVAIPPGAKPPASPDDAIEPWPVPPVRVRMQIRIKDYSFEVEELAVARRATSTRVDILPLELVPAVSLAVDPRQIVLRENEPAKMVELMARVRYAATSAAKIAVGLDAPAGWQVAPVAPLDFLGPGDRLVRFVVTPPARPAAGAYELKPYARRGEKVFRTSREPLPTLPARSWSEPAEATVHVLELMVPERLRVGYVAAENDPIPEALRQIGVHVELLDEAALAFGDLSRFDAIAIGIRAYELRDDLARANPRLLDYVTRGGVLVVQYQRDFVWNRLQPAPYPATMSQPTARITDENSPVQFLLPESSLLNFPNRITASDFEGWVQERGLYFWSKFDSRYSGVLGMRDPGEGEETGGLVYTRLGKGVYLYTGLAFFRQLPAGVPGAYRLFVNLLSQSKAPR